MDGPEQQTAETERGVDKEQYNDICGPEFKRIRESLGEIRGAIEDVDTMLRGNGDIGLKARVVRNEGRWRVTIGILSAFGLAVVGIATKSIWTLLCK